MPLTRKPVATVDAGNLCLAPGERAIVPARWDRKVPEEHFWCEESSLSGVTVQAGLCPGSSQEVMLNVFNSSGLVYTLERGLPLAEAQGETGPCSIDSFDYMMTAVCSELSGSPRSTGLPSSSHQYALACSTEPSGASENPRLRGCAELERILEEDLVQEEGEPGMEEPLGRALEHLSKAGGFAPDLRD